MRKIFYFIAAMCVFYSCKNNSIPDVSGIKIDVKVERFEKDFFSIDTNKILPSLDELKNKYPLFINDFMGQILGFSAQTPPDSLAKYVRAYIKDYKFVKDSADKLFGDFDSQAKDIKNGLQFVKYYFPDYKIPDKIITFIGPFDGYSDVLTKDALEYWLVRRTGTLPLMVKIFLMLHFFFMKKKLKQLCIKLVCLIMMCLMSTAILSRHTTGM